MSAALARRRARRALSPSFAHRPGVWDGSTAPIAWGTGVPTAKGSASAGAAQWVERGGIYTLETVAASVARAQYGNSVFPGVISEGQVVNLLTNPRAPQSWGAQWNVAADTSLITDVSGVLRSGHMIHEDATASAVHGIAQAPTMAASRYVMAAIMREASRRWVRLAFHLSLCWFDLHGSGAMGTNQNCDDRAIVSLGNGWFLCWLSGTPAAGAVTVSVLLGSADNVSTFNGANQDSIYLDHAALHLGDYPALPFSGTKAADCLTYNVANQLGTAEGAIRFRLGGPAFTCRAVRIVLDLQRTGSAEYVWAYVSTDGKLYVLAHKDGTTDGLITGPAVNGGATHDCQLEWDGASMWILVDGTRYTAANTGKAWSGWSTLTVGSSVSSTAHTHPLRVGDLKLFPRKLGSALRTGGGFADRAPRQTVDVQLPDGDHAALKSQVTICCIGDSITWNPDPAECHWREYLLRKIPWLAFAGRHTDVIGYSHEGEGGNGSQQVIDRLSSVPNSPWYHLLVGTNDGCTDATTARATADRILTIVDALIARSGCDRVFVGALLPDADDEDHDDGNTLVNGYLATDLASRTKATLVDYNTAIKAQVDWEDLFVGLHPTLAGQQVQADTLATALAAATRPTVVPLGVGCGVRVTNLWDAVEEQTEDLIAGWYIFSLTAAVTGASPTVDLSGGGTEFNGLVVAAGRNAFHVATGFEGYGYTRGPWTITAHDCTISLVLVEKRRPSLTATTYQAGSSFVDAAQARAGEVVENP